MNIPVIKMAGDSSAVERQRSIQKEKTSSKDETLLQEPSWNLRPPNSQRLIPSGAVANRGLIIHQISIRIVLDHVAGSIPPVIKDLRPENMPTDTPHRLVVLVCEPLMAQFLRIKVMHFKRAMVDMCCGVCAHEETVVIDVLAATVDMSEERDILLFAFLFHV